MLRRKRGPRPSYPNQMPDYRPSTLRQLPPEQLYLLVAQEGANTMQGVAGRVEMRRRENATARWALGVSILSLIVSAVAIAMRAN